MGHSLCERTFKWAMLCVKEHLNGPCFVRMEVMNLQKPTDSGQPAQFIAISEFCTCEKTSIPHDSITYLTLWILWIHNYVMIYLAFCITEVHKTGSCHILLIILLTFQERTFIYDWTL